MSRRTDPKTGEQFDCGADEGRCWCMDLKPLNLPAEGDCIGPTRLKALAKEEQDASSPD